MDFFGIGWEELFLILVIALIIFGPGKIPEFARTMGKAVREFNRYMTTLTKDFREEFEKGLEGKIDNPEEEKKDKGHSPKPSETSEPKVQSKEL